MKRFTACLLAGAVVGAGIVIGLVPRRLDAQQNVLVSKKVAAPPPMEPALGDAWKSARPLTVKAIGGRNLPGGSTEVTLRSVHSGDAVYFLVQYKDPTQSFQRSPWVKQADGSWKQLKDPDDKGGDNNKYYEDKFALIWSINNSIKGFEEQGCMALCHAGEAGKPYGNKYTASEGEIGDIWHMKSVRTGYIGQTDDQYVDHTRYDKDKAPEAGRKSDPKTGGGYTDMKLVDGKPEFMSKKGIAANNKRGLYYLKESDKAPFDDRKFKPGGEVASILVTPFTGDRGDIATSIRWSKGKYTAVLARKLVTGSKYDVQFDNLDGTYLFGLAAFDNAQVRHAFQMGSLKLRFAK
jgi:Ethylbenzene dehydrogenase